MDLPTEIRLKIYQKLFLDAPPVTIPIQPPALFLTCRQILKEAHEVFFRSSKFLFELQDPTYIHPKYLAYYEEHLPVDKLGLIRKLRFSGKVPTLHWGLEQVAVDIDIGSSIQIWEIHGGELVPFVSRGCEFERIAIEELNAVQTSIAAQGKSQKEDLRRFEHALSSNC